MKSQRCNQAQQRGHRSQPLRLGHRSTLEQMAGQPGPACLRGWKSCSAGTRPQTPRFGNGRFHGETATGRHQTESITPRSPPVQPLRPLFFSKLAPYIRSAGSPAMEINDRRNKPFGPGGSTRRLHPSPPSQDGFRRGRTRIDEGVKGEFFLGMVPPLSGYAIVANDNYAPVAQAA